jgi:hypothetical protein
MLVAPLHPLAEQWEPLGHFPVYQVMLRGPTKVEYLFLEYAQDPTPPVKPSNDTLAAINTHFWDWIWWLATREAAGRHDLVVEHLAQLFRHVLELEYGTTVARTLENEICRGIRRNRASARPPLANVRRTATPTSLLRSERHCSARPGCGGQQATGGAPPDLKNWRNFWHAPCADPQHSRFQRCCHAGGGTRTPDTRIMILRRQPSREPHKPRVLCDFAGSLICPTSLATALIAGQTSTRARASRRASSDRD